MWISPKTGPFALQFCLGKRDISLMKESVQTHHRPGGAYTFIVKEKGQEQIPAHRNRPSAI